MALHHPVIDADTHYYEPRDAFNRHLDRKHWEKGIRVVRDEHGREQVLVGHRLVRFIIPEFETTTRPGALREMLRRMSTGDFKESDARQSIQPEYRDRNARLAKMDGQGITASLLLPTIAVGIEHYMRDDVQQTYLNLQAFNEWLDEDWGFHYQDRIFAVPLVSLLDVDNAVKQLEWLLNRGARIIHIRPGPTGNGHSPADPIYDPFWARVNEAGIAVACHISESGYNELLSPLWGEYPYPSSHKQSALQWSCFMGDRPIMEMISALIFHNLFGRYPNVKVLSVENGSLWVPYLLKQMDKMNGMGRNGPWLGGRLAHRPSEIFKQHVFVSPYHEEDIKALVALIGAERVVFGSDFPHPEGLAEPLEFADALEGLPSEAIRSIMFDNANQLLGGVITADQSIPAMSG
ncbi:MAG: amidohydrolase family protein [Actinomycetota bacterium]